MDILCPTPRTPRGSTSSSWDPPTPTPSTPPPSSASDRYIPPRTPPSHHSLAAYDLCASPIAMKYPCDASNNRADAADRVLSPSLGPLPDTPHRGGAGVGELGREPYTSLVARTLFDSGDELLHGVLGTRPTPPSPARAGEACRFADSRGAVYFENARRNFRTTSFRIIPQTPERILDAPELLDDYYLNLLDWSSQNVLSVALSSTVYLWNADNGGITQLVTLHERDRIVTSLAWHCDGHDIAVSCSNSSINVWNADTRKVTFSYRPHNSRVAALAWNGNVLATGSRDTTVRLHDVREPPGHCGLRTVLHGHSHEVCGLRWAPQGHLLASGGNDNVVNVWDVRRLGQDSSEVSPLWSLQAHVAAVKALAWNPVVSNVLVSGGGTADRCLRFWDVSTGACTRVVDTKSQVCGLLWNTLGTELVSSHGYSNHQLSLWKYPSLKLVTELTGHTSRVLHLALSPDGETVVSAAGDETIRFWRIFANRQKGCLGHPSETSMGSQDVQDYDLR